MLSGHLLTTSDADSPAASYNMDKHSKILSIVLSQHQLTLNAWLTYRMWLLSNDDGFLQTLGIFFCTSKLQKKETLLTLTHTTLTAKLIKNQCTWQDCKHHSCFSSQLLTLINSDNFPMTGYVVVLWYCMTSSTDQVLKSTSLLLAL